MEKLEISGLQQKHERMNTAQARESCTEMTAPGRTADAPEGATQQRSVTLVIKLPYTLLPSNWDSKTGQRNSLTFILPRGPSKRLCIVQNGYHHVRLALTWIFLHYASLLSATL